MMLDIRQVSAGSPPKKYGDPPAVYGFCLQILDHAGVTDVVRAVLKREEVGYRVDQAQKRVSH